MSSVELNAGHAGPLAGVRVLDLSSVVMGPFATHILAGLGADVVKVEPPEGDIIRHVGPMANPAMGHIFLHLNRGKRSVVLDLKRAADLATFKRMIPAFDVLIFNVREQAMKRLGLDYASVQGLHPRMIYVSASGYGDKGPYAGRPAYDDLIQGATGLAWANQVATAGEPRYVPAMIADRMSGLHAVYCVTAALYSRERSGIGQQVTVSMYEAMAQSVLGDHLAGRTFEPAQGPAGYSRMLTPDRRPYRTKDGYLCALIYNDGHWTRFFGEIGRNDLAGDPLFASITSRAARINDVYAFVATTLVERSSAEWSTIFDRADIPYSRVNSIDDLVTDPQLLASELLGTELHPTEGLLRTLGQPTSWSGTPLVTARPAPRLGQHTDEVLAEFAVC